MSYEIINGFNFSSQNGVIKIRGHCNNVVPADMWKEELRPTADKSMNDILKTIMYECFTGCIQPVMSCTQLKYAILKALEANPDPKQPFDYEWINKKLVLGPRTTIIFEAFRNALEEKDSKKEWYIKDRSYYCIMTAGTLYRYAYRTSVHKLTYKQAYLRANSVWGKSLNLTMIQERDLPETDN